MRIRSISPRIWSSCMTISLGQRLFDLTEDSSHRAPFPFEKSQAIPKADEFSLCRGVHRETAATLTDRVLIPRAGTPGRYR